MVLPTSTHGGFCARRSVHAQAKEMNGRQSDISCDSDPAASEANANMLNLILLNNQATDKATMAATCIAGSRRTGKQFKCALSTVKLLLLVIVLHIFTYQTPTSVSGLPRHLIGRHLILPSYQINLHKLRDQPQRFMSQGEDSNITYVNRTVLNCTDKIENNSAMFNLVNVNNASLTANRTAGAMKDIFEIWIVNCTNTNVSEHEGFYRFHHLDLTHALMDEVEGNNVSETKEPIKEVEKIRDTLKVLLHMCNALIDEMGTYERQTFFQHFQHMIEHNLHDANVILSSNCSDVPAYSYNVGHMSVKYGFIRESLKVLVLIEKMYNVMMVQIQE